VQEGKEVLGVARASSNSFSVFQICSLSIAWCKASSKQSQSAFLKLNRLRNGLRNLSVLLVNREKAIVTWSEPVSSMIDQLSNSVSLKLEEKKARSMIEGVVSFEWKKVDSSWLSS